MNEDFAEDTITLIDDEGIEREFEILDSIENENGRFYALLPNFELPDDAPDKDDTYFIFEVIDEGGEEQLAELEDNDLLDELAEIFERRFEECSDDEYDDDVDDNA